MSKILGADVSIKTTKEVELMRQYYLKKVKNKPSFGRRLELLVASDIGVYETRHLNITVTLIVSLKMAFNSWKEVFRWLSVNTSIWPLLIFFFFEIICCQQIQQKLKYCNYSFAPLWHIHLPVIIYWAIVIWIFCAHCHASLYRSFLHILDTMLVLW